MKTAVFLFGITSALAGCAAGDGAGLGLLTTGSVDAVGASTRAIRVTASGPNRIFVFAGLDGQCKAVDRHEFVVEAMPAQGQISFQKDHETTVQFSLSGKCVGQRVAGTAVFYTARSGARGVDTFSVAARLSNGDRATRSFTVSIAE